MPTRHAALVLAMLALAATLGAPPASATDACVGVVCLIDQPVLQAVPGDHHQCFLLADGDVRCSGGNEWGQADGRSQKDAVAIAAGTLHTCALLRSGNVDCFGLNDVGQSEDYLGGDAIGIGAAMWHTCALLRSGNVACWGENWQGRADDWLSGGAVAIDLTNYYTCALFEDTTVDCWGIEDGTFGQTYGWPAGGVVALGGGDQHTCVVLADGNVRCWGTGHWGAMDPYDSGDAVAVDGGYDATCILTTGGDVRCQGRNTSEDGSCVHDLVETHPLACEGLEMGRDRRARDDGRVRAFALHADAGSACYVLDDATAECVGIVPVFEPEPSGRNELALAPRGAALTDPGAHTPAIPVHQETSLVVPVRVCPLTGTCVGYVVLDAGTGPIEAEVPAQTVILPLEAHAHIEEAWVAFDPTAQETLQGAAGISARACVESTCAGIP